MRYYEAGETASYFGSPFARDAATGAYQPGREGRMIASTGKILAMVSSPSYDPNLLATHDADEQGKAWTQLGDDPDSPLTNRAIAETYPPGSTFKVVTASAGLESGKVTETTPSFPVSTGYQPPLTTRTIRNFDGANCGGTLFELLRVSCNGGFAAMGAEVLGPEIMIGGAEAFGFNDVPPIDLPGAVRSVFPTDFGKRLRDGDDPGDAAVYEKTPQLAQASIGQNDVSATPLQMAMVAAAVRNDGVVMQPYLVESVRSADLQVLSQTRPSQLRIATSASNASKLRQMMIDVVTGGTGWRAKISGVTVGGKTGTANSDNIRTPYAWFIAWADNPEVAVCVFVQDAEMEATDVAGGRVAAPIAKAVIEALR